MDLFCGRGAIKKAFGRGLGASCVLAVVSLRPQRTSLVPDSEL